MSSSNKIGFQPNDWPPAWGAPMVAHLSLDGDAYCILIGEDLQAGVAGFGDSPAEALRALANELEALED